MTTDSSTPDTVVFIHGLWMTSLCWEHWIDRYNQRGIKTLAPSWPGFEGDVEALRRDPTPIAKVGVREILDHYEGIIRGLDRPPIIMGHSFGGAFTNVLIDRGLGAAGVSIDGATMRGIRDLPLSTLKSSFGVLKNPLNRGKAVPITPGQFHYAFTNTLSEAESLPIYERYTVPAAANVLLDGATANLNPKTSLKVDFARDDRAPQLFIAGGVDHVIPASVTRSIVRHYAKSKALTAIKEYPGRSHYTLGQEGWEEMADFALDWALSPRPL